TDRPRPALETFRGARVTLHVNAALTAALKRLSQQAEVTLFMTLLAAFQTLLGRYSGQTDIAVGTGLAGRPYQEVEGLIGFFVNTLVMRADLAAHTTFQALLHHVRQVVLDGMRHQEVPFEHIVQALQPDRSIGYNPLFQVMLVLENF